MQAGAGAAVYAGEAADCAYRAIQFVVETIAVAGGRVGTDAAELGDVAVSVTVGLKRPALGVALDGGLGGW